MEKKKHPDYLKKIEGMILKIEIEIGAQDELLKECPEIINPNEDSKNTEKKNNNIEEHNKELDRLKGELQGKESEKSGIISRIESLKQFKIKIEQQEKYLNDFLQNSQKYKEILYNLDIKKILKVNSDYSSIDELIRDAGKKLVNIGVYFKTYESIVEKNIQDDNESIVCKIQFLEGIIKSETDKLTGDEKAYQKNEQRKKSINEKIQELTGIGETPANETLNYYKKEKGFIEEDLSGLLNTKRRDRIDLTIVIFNKKNEIVGLYNKFKKSVDDKITENKSLLEGYDIKIDSSFNLVPSFYDEFLGFINQGRSGCYRGADEGRNRIKTIVDDNGFSDEDEIRKLLEAIILSLEENSAEISEQVNKDKLTNFFFKNEILNIG